MQIENDHWLDQLKWNADGLVAAIAVDHKTNEILMQAWVNRQALQLSAEEGRAVYWSRSRNKLWRKGESSGHVQKLHEIRLDCDGDSLLYRVEQLGDIACHTGRRSCFYKRLDPTGWTDADPVLTPPEEIYRN
ncbi:phosphoribosyl-AMP cyclohydrolase [Pelagibaculum spongiae]|uniref:Phosphoribosyl-AMP cyclohydrolase n=1 Tax=Pelagibaculum spongiae TaxID=2080658 RepID=A0A2V1H0E5_9GAMM|nr:phosphoribosyl-AMP cyclohydrolase [Pelagibaculum spongiae]PVZ68140.1 phosphoribosyl-AMP cyclohydrolase [Pelagibaculum spongiae]